MGIKRYIIIASLLFTLPGFTSVKLQAQGYATEIQTWHAKRIQSLKSENGWLNLEGLYWLDEGKNSFGTTSTNKIVFPAGTITGEAGYFERQGSTVRLIVASGTTITVNGKATSDAIVFSPDSTRQPVAAHKDLRWTIIKRDDKIGIRLRNLKSKHLEEFAGIKTFPVDSVYRVQATLQTVNQPQSVMIKNVLGQTNSQKLAGKLVFELEKKKYMLDAIEEGSQLFIIFGDATSGDATYVSGRFLYASKPGPDGTTTLDFNKAINPPCAFTEYATCPIPPPQNILPVAVNAGEKNYDLHK